MDAQGRDWPGPVPLDPEEGARKVAKESVEYFVVQKSLRKSKEGPWKLWGQTEEMTLDKLARQERKK